MSFIKCEQPIKLNVMLPFKYMYHTVVQRTKNREQKNQFLVLSQNSDTHHSHLGTVDHCCDLETEVFGYSRYSIFFLLCLSFSKKTTVRQSNSMRLLVQSTQAGFKFRSLPAVITKRSTDWEKWF